VVHRGITPKARPFLTVPLRLAPCSWYREPLRAFRRLGQLKDPCFVVKSPRLTGASNAWDPRVAEAKRLGDDVE
jgi:hypothetical protein